MPGPSSTIDSTRIRDPLIGTMLGDYQVLGPIGEGGMGVVYEGLHTVINKRVAIKVIKPEFTGDHVLVRRVLVEAQAVNAVRHRGIVDIHAHGLTPDGRPYLVMELLQGETLNDLLLRKGQLTRVEAIQLILEATGPLLAAHRAGIVHRDLKPSNLFLCTDDDGERFLKLLDFGLAKRTAQGASSSTMTSASLIVGTPNYMAPEQARAQPTDERTDIYALGVLSFELLAGRLPFVADSSVDLVMMHLTSPVPRLTDLDPSIPLELSNLIEQMMAKEPSARPQTLEPVRALLKQFSGRQLNSGPIFIPKASPQRKGGLATPSGIDNGPIRQRVEAAAPEVALELTAGDRTTIASVLEPQALGSGDSATSLWTVHPGSKEAAPASNDHSRRTMLEADVEQLRQEVTTAARTAAAETVVPEREDTPPPFPGRSPKLPFIIAAVLILIIIGGLAVMFSGGNEEQPVHVIEEPPPRVPALAPIDPPTPAPQPQEPPPAEAVTAVKPAEGKPVEVKPVDARPVRPSAVKHGGKGKTGDSRPPTQAELRARLEKIRTRFQPGSTGEMLARKYAAQLEKPLTEPERKKMAKTLDELQQR